MPSQSHTSDSTATVPTPLSYPQSSSLIFGRSQRLQKAYLENLEENFVNTKSLMLGAQRPKDTSLGRLKSTETYVSEVIFKKKDEIRSKARLVANFLYGALEEIIYVQQLEGFVVPNKTYHVYTSDYDNCVYHRNLSHDSYVQLFFFYVDDMLIACKYQTKINTMKI
ncbi:hypothetical protein CR513_52727, partial [Mucuna pruriens]